MPTHPYVSRFFVNDDARREQLVYQLPESWWSRPYEYEWCINFISPHDTVLDATCGISHPLKFYLAEICEEVYACDVDRRILSREAVLSEIAQDIGVDAVHEVVQSWSDNLHLAHTNLTSLPYADESFDTIFCISVLEHLSLQESAAVLKEFHRTLNEEGLLVLTFGYPTVSLPSINELLLHAGFVYWGETDFRLPDNAVYSGEWGGLNCFRAILKKII
ncbi:class I SAM-dependent methyltransferase [Paenibacillus sp. sgz500958]|uniref:class I SAM-dependent methyltransferase n=1 Tax=Paenibacillus sp. sgz500958 TaxID=3242475 RepID=UPI0036D3D650